MIYVVARSEDSGKRFLARNAAINDCTQVLLGQDSYFQVLSNVIDQCPNDYALVVHDDVTFPKNFRNLLDSLIVKLANQPNWGLVGNAGHSTLRLGLASSPVIRYLADPHGGINYSGDLVPCQSIDGNTMLLNTKLMRERMVTLPKYHGFHLYDLVLSIEAISQGLSVFVAPELACFHSSKGDQSAFDDASISDRFRSDLAQKVRNRSINSLNGPIDLDLFSDSFWKSDRCEVVYQSLRNALDGQKKKSLAIVVRTQFKRKSTLRRTLSSITSFTSRATFLNIEVVVATGCQNQDVQEFGPGIRLMQFDTSSHTDDRFELIRLAAKNLKTDFIWFIDDDDWLFPNAGEEVSLIVGSAPLGSTIFFDSQHFLESNIEKSDQWLIQPSEISVGRRFDGDRFMSCLSGHNWIPFCSVIFDRHLIADLEDSQVENVIYYEDFLLILNAIINPAFHPIYANLLVAGISVRSEGGEVVVGSREHWNDSMVEVVSNLLRSSHPSLLLSLPRVFLDHSLRDLERLKSEQQNTYEQLLKVSTDMQLMANSWSWRLTRIPRLFRKILVGEISVVNVLKKLSGRS